MLFGAPEQTLFLQLLAGALISAFVRAAEGMEVNAICQSGQRCAAAGFQPLHKLGDVIPGRNLQGGGKLTVNGVLYLNKPGCS